MYPNPYGNQPGQPQSGFQPPPYPTQNQGPGYPPAPPPAYPAAPYPPQPQSGFGGYPQAPSSGGYPPQPNTGIYPNQPGGVPYPNQPPNPGYPNQPGGVPYPSQPPTSGYPNQPNSGYPNQPLNSGYPNQPPNSGYPNQPGGIGFPNQQQPSFGAPPSYPPQAGPYPSAYPPAQGQQQPPAYGSYSPNRAPEYPIAPPTTGYQTASAPSYQQQPLSSNYGPPGGHSNSNVSYGSVSASAYPSSPSHQQRPVAKMAGVPTIPNVPNDSTTDAQVLRKAMKGFGTDEAAIIGVLAKRTSAQRIDIARAYKTSFGKDLIKDLKSELGGRLEQVVLALMTPQFDYLAEVVKRAMAGIGTKETALVDVLCTATNQEICQINASYTKLYHTTIERDLQGDTSGSFGRLLISMTTGGRNENPVADAAIAEQDAKTLYEAGEKKWGTDESAFNSVLATRSYPQLRAMFEAYERLYSHPFEKAIDKEFSGDVKRGMLAVVKAARNRAAYFAERIHNSVAGLGTKDDDLIFLIVTRAEIDLETVKQEYQRLYNKSLVSDVGGDTGGDYKKILLALSGN